MLNGAIPPPPHKGSADKPPPVPSHSKTPSPTDEVDQLADDLSAAKLQNGAPPGAAGTPPLTPKDQSSTPPLTPKEQPAAKTPEPVLRPRSKDKQAADRKLTDEEVVVELGSFFSFLHCFREHA